MSATTTPFPRAVIFDAYGTLFDVHSVIAAAEQLFPSHGNALSQLWRQKQIEYTQLRTLAARTDAPGEHYRPFWDITLDALRFAAKKLQLTLGRVAEKRLMDEYACLSAFPDAVPVLRALREAASNPNPSLNPDQNPAPSSASTTAAATTPHVGLAILSNGNPQMLDIAVKSAGMSALFDHVLSVDAVRAYKPSPAAYALGPAAFGVAAREIVFVSSNGWDVAGATWFGFTTFWLNRQNAPLEELGVTPHGTGSGMNDLLAFLRAPDSPSPHIGQPEKPRGGGTRKRAGPRA
ncbi:(S)-2-haloacid dehalogenase [Paraburkholderia sp. Cy-641]|uniref:(S)-2-haloacid dehalogenase n=1 Tax=Paraburkholderia sp. Cy-641 TaxID=2608337 RepID=UPI0014219737|nr:(S)-2-haloacid dehalogenase [Paraburkholderia sp. Cy-641]NIF77044.1 (S)-2-haloacid dehalogenase [Paraburkholderia sp. Cy-641]